MRKLVLLSVFLAMSVLAVSAAADTHENSEYDNVTAQSDAATGTMHFAYAAEVSTAETVLDTLEHSFFCTCSAHVAWKVGATGDGSAPHEGMTETHFNLDYKLEHRKREAHLRDDAGDTVALFSSTDNSYNPYTRVDQRDDVGDHLPGLTVQWVPRE